MQDVLPYDKNRVRLRRGRLAERTYINASLIRTICHQPAIVVTQCPTEDTVAEFWKTVWELNIGSVVMLVPCDCRGAAGPVYWPRSPEQPTVYSDVEVELVTEMARAHFVLRRFHLHGWEGECLVSRLVSHWQFLRWTPASSTSCLPHHPLQFLDFVRDFQTRHCPDTGVLVHCGVGAGFSGVFLAVDALSTDGRRSGHVDVEECVTLLCLERMNVVRTFRQYRYIYYCLMELFDTGHDTSIPVSCFHFAYTNLIQRGSQTGLSHLDHEFCVLSFPCYGLAAQKTKMKKTPCDDNNNNDNNNDSYNDCHRNNDNNNYNYNDSKNNDNNNDDDDSYNDNNDDNNNYNDNNNDSARLDERSWVLDGYLTSRLFVVPRRGLQHPDEFWQTVVDHSARTAVVLCPLEQSGLSVPRQGQTTRVGGGRISLECTKVRQNPCRSFLVYDLMISGAGQQHDIDSDECGGDVSGQAVRLYEFLAWPDAVPLPQVASVVLLKYSQQG